MTAHDIQNAVCAWISSMGFTAIMSPTSKPAPAGNYFSVSVTGMRQDGSRTNPGPAKEGESKHDVVQNVATVSIHEVEGDGENLRAVRNGIDSDAFDEFVSNRFASDDSEDRAFSVWDTGAIQDLSSKDGDFWIRQSVFTFDVHFNDFFDHAALPMESVNLDLNGTEISIKRES